MLKRDIEGLSKRLDELEDKHQKDIDALYAELAVLKTQIAEQGEVNGTQQSGINVIRVITTVGLCIGSVSLLGNVVLLLLLLKKNSLLR